MHLLLVHFRKLIELTIYWWSFLCFFEGIFNTLSTLKKWIIKTTTQWIWIKICSIVWEHKNHKNVWENYRHWQWKKYNWRVFSIELQIYTVVAPSIEKKTAEETTDFLLYYNTMYWCWLFAVYEARVWCELKYICLFTTWLWLETKCQLIKQNIH